MNMTETNKQILGILKREALRIIIPGGTLIPSPIPRLSPVATRPTPLTSRFSPVMSRVSCLATFVSLLALAPSASAQFVNAKYGGDFLSIGAGARALGMGSAYVAVADEVTAAYWNPAGLNGITNYQGSYMHSERFSGVVSYDYAGFVLPANNNGVLALSVFRQGVDNIKNTLNVYNDANGIPDPSQITTFSATDMAVYLTYANVFRDKINWGVSAKVINSRLGPFADAWGYSLDLGIQKRTGDVSWGINLMDATTLMKFWSVDRESLANIGAVYGDDIPEGQNERVLPTLKAGLAKRFYLPDLAITAAADVDVRFEGRNTFYLNTGDISYEPNVGAEFSYKELVHIRAGLTQFSTDTLSSKLYVNPTVGAGVTIGMVQVDYGFSRSPFDLGNTHRVSLMVNLPRREPQVARR
jgi:hypothetical protein